MTTDTVLYALTTVQRHLTTTDDLDADQKRRMSLTTGYLRDCLLREDATAFSAAVDRGMGQQPDLYDFMLEELFEELAITNRDQLEATLTATV